MKLSLFHPLTNKPVEFPAFTGTRVMMMPVRLGYSLGVPEQYDRVVQRLYGVIDEALLGEVGYLTIDEKQLDPGDTLRNPGWHVDAGIWGGGGGAWIGKEGMVLLSSTDHCELFVGSYEDKPGKDGECPWMDEQIADGSLRGGLVSIGAGIPTWVGPDCIHRTVPVEKPTTRQWLRLSLPNDGAWYNNWTPNPAGIEPTGLIRPAEERWAA